MPQEVFINFKNKILPFLLSDTQEITSKAKNHFEKLIPSAVLFPFVYAENQWQIILTKRHQNLVNHPHQVAFAGGRRNSGETVQECALREAFEEINLHSDFVEVLGLLPNINTRSGFLVVPVVALVYNHSNLHANVSEVENFFLLPWSHLVNHQNWFLEEKLIDDYVYQGYTTKWQTEDGVESIWGATAKIIYGLAKNFYI